ncbi:MAG: nucleotidyltransferase family protein [Candidatus Manganitrophus sp.]|nr:nucleotidyltransferase family protein [Candidatus Manganitrophus sp.]WDT77275.1 MAG: nucleotidyltransferase family protein [Candidatus Manganitrophus sp.]
MKAMILAAGYGTRLRPLTNDLPKPLLPVGPRPLIYYNLLLLKKYGITDVFINVHYLADKIIKEVGNGLRLGMNITYSEESQILGTGGGIKNIQTAIARGTFLVVNADILIDLNLDKLVEFHHRKKGAATLVLREDPEVDRFGAIEVDPKDQIRNILGKTTWNGEKARRMMFTGVHVMEPHVMDYVPPRTFYSITDAYVEMLRKNEKLFGYVTRGYWNDIGEIDRYKKADRDLKQGKIRLSYIRSETAV